MNVAFSIVAVLLVCNSGFSSGCNEPQAEKCFADMAEDLGNGESGMTSMELFQLLNPTSDSQQEHTCTRLRNHDFSSVKKCVAACGCADTNLLPPELSGPGIPVITWSDSVDLVKGICQKGCEKLASKSEEAMQCIVSATGGGNNNNDMCGLIGNVFGCMRTAIGKCKVLVKFMESTLETMGMPDMAEQCPNVDTDLSHGGSDSSSSSSEEEEEPSGCNEATVQVCFTSMAQATGLAEDQLGSNDLMDLVNPGQGAPDAASVDAEQQRVCSGLASYDMSILRACITSSGCADTSLLPPEVAGMPGSPHISWMTIVDLLEGMCKPGCENMGTMNQEVQTCSAGMQAGSNDDPCGAMDNAFKCFRNAIGRCDIMVSFTNDILNSMGVIDLVKAYCPDVNFDLSASAEKKRNNNFKTIKNLHKRLNYLTLPTQVNLLKASKRFHELNLNKRLSMIKQERALKALKAYNVHGRH